MPIDRRMPGVSRRLLLAGAGAAVARPAWAQSYPTRPVRIVVAYSAGSGPDQIARLLARALQEVLGRSFIVENRPGALGILGTGEVARSKPDGYTLLLTTNTGQAANVALVKDLPYDPIHDFAPIALLVTAPLMLMVRPDFPATDVKGLAAYAKSHDGGLSAGYGSAASQVSTAKLQRGLGIDLVTVPYSAIPLAINDVLGGHLDLAFADMPVAVPQLRAGRLKALGVTSHDRVASVPDVPALSETFPGFQVAGWQGMVAPAGTPEAVVNRLSDVLLQLLRQPDMLQRLDGMFQQVQPLGPGPFGDFIKAEVARWSKDVADAGIEKQ